jgi:uncharacterized protein (DUF1501 family)
MKTVSLNWHAIANCDGVSRRDLLRVGTLSALGLSLAEFLQFRQAAAAEGSSGKDRNCILLYMNGGPSHIDTFDPKPEAEADIRGEFSPINTKAGFQVSEHLSKMAGVADKLAVVRSFTSPEGSHERACHYMQTGYRQLPTIEYPSYGSVVLKEKGFRTTLPPYVAIPQTPRGGAGGYLGAVYQPFSVGDPGQPRFTVRDVVSPVGDERLKARAALLQEQDADFRKNDPDRTLAALDEFYTRAYDLVGSPEARKAFDLASEPEAVKDAYGRTSIGQGCLMARRMIEAGTRFVTVTQGGWDTHGNNFRSLKDRLLPPLDQAFSTLVQDLTERGMLESTLVVWMGDFGRTPRVNRNAGRDHYPRCSSIVLAGGGVRGGQVIGKSDATGSAPAERPVGPEDLAATLYHLLGIDGGKVYETATGRPMRIAPDGQLIKELTG